ncbi:MAG TPA: response regulator [Acidobacteriota bacterium]|nr:response regulator [Acidobacteriota bacterium]HNG95166.1 response regulator [Acidobacteriota bacterium]HNH83861.1 response regulator [Acidobacteriota bacterium]
MPQPKILIVDDNAKNRAICEEILMDEYELCHAVDGVEALEKVPVFQPDLILLDLMMPRMDGYEVCRRLKSDPHTTHVMIVCVSAKGQTAEIVEGFQAKADDYIVKPFSEEELLARVRAALRLKLTQDELKRVNTNLEEIVAKRTAQLIEAERLAVIGRNVAQMAHNFRGALTTITLSAQLGAAGVGEPKEHFSRVERSAQNIIKVIATTLTRIKQKETIHPEPTDINAILQSIQEFLDLDARYKTCQEKSFILAEGLPSVTGIPGDFQQIFENLIYNALDAMEESVRRTLHVRSYWNQTESAVMVEIKDSGSGISEANLARIFDPLFTTKSSGTGLGLASCQQLLETYGGCIRVESIPGEGSTFTVLLPVKK